MNKSLDINKKLVSAHYNLALVYQSIGDFEKSLHHLNQIDSISPEFTKADKTKSALINYLSDENHLNKMKNKLANLNLNFDQKINLYFGISKAHEDKKEFKQAFEYLENGNNLKRTQSNYNINEDVKLFTNIKKLFKNYQFKTNDLTSEQKKPIFIKEAPKLFMLGMFQTAGFTGFLIWALMEGGASKTAVLTFTMPMWVALMAWPFLQEKISLSQWISIGVCLLGIVFIFAD